MRTYIKSYEFQSRSESLIIENCLSLTDEVTVDLVLKCLQHLHLLALHLEILGYIPHLLDGLVYLRRIGDFSHIPCSNSNVLPTSNFLDLWYTSGILVTYVPVSNSRRGHCYPGLRPIRYYGVFGVQNHGVSRAEFSLTEPIPLQAVYIHHSRNMARLGHEHMALDSKSSFALAVDFF